jgi:hypothetical protein
VTLNGASYNASSTITNIEVLSLKAATAQTFDANALTGLTSIVDNAGIALLTVTNIGSASTALGLTNITAANGGLTASFADAALTGTNDTVTLNLNGAGVTGNTPAVIVQSMAATNGAENLSVASTGANSSLASLNSFQNGGANAVLKKLVVTGDKNLTIATALDFVGTTGAIVDASAFTGKLSVGIDTNVVASVVGGSGDDTFNFTTGLTTDDTVDGGAGTADTLRFVATSFTLASNKVSNIEVIDQQAAAGANNLTMTTGGAALSKVVLREVANASNQSVTVSDLAAGAAVDLVSVTDTQQFLAATLGLKDASGTADALTVTLQGVTAHGTADNAVTDLVITNIETLNLVSSTTSTDGTTLAAVDANLISDISSDTTLTSINASGSSALTVVVGSEATKLTKFDASKMTADTKITLAAGDVAVSTGSGDDTIIFAATLNNKDTVVAGANTLSTTEDLLTATVTDLTATTGALSISGVERINLTNGGTAVIDATKITGATEIAVDGVSTATTISGLSSGAKIGLGFKGADVTNARGTLTLTLADATGTADTVTLNVNEVTDADTTAVTLKTTAIETVNLAYSTTIAALGSLTVTSTDLTATTINVTGSDADTDNTTTLGTLNAATTKLDGSTFKGVLSATAGTGTAITFLGNGAQANVLTGSTGADTFTIGSTTATQDLTGGTGSDTVNITISGATSFASIDQMETINITVAASATTSSNNDGALNDTNLTKLTINGGNSLSTFANTGISNTATVTTIDASAFAGKANLVFGDDGLLATRTITGGASTDTVAASYSNIGSVGLKMSAIETLLITETTAGAATDTLDLGSVTGLTKVTVVDTANVGNTIVLTNFDLTKTSLQLGNAADTGGAGTGVFGVVTVTGASISGATDALTVTVKDLDSTGTATLNADGIETINLSIATDVAQAQTLSVSDVNATNKFVVNVTDGTAAQGFTLGSVSTNATSVNASTFIGNLTFTSTARVGSTAMTITGGTGTDALNMKNANDVIDGGTGTDTLSIVQNAVLGGFLIDLSSTVDQITTYNGSANSAVQKGFENVNLSNVTGNFGADVTARSAGSTITGTTNGDVITLGAGVDTIVNNDSTMDTYNSFTKGAAGDVINISLAALEAAGGSGINAAASNFTKLNSAADGADVAAGASVIQELTLDGTGGTVNAGNADIFVMIARTLANTDAVETALEAGGDVALTINAADDVAGQAFLVVYSDGTDAFLASVRVNAATNADTDFEATNLTAVNIAKLVGITSIATTDFNLANFTYVA